MTFIMAGMAVILQFDQAAGPGSRTPSRSRQDRCAARRRSQFWQGLPPGCRPWIRIVQRADEFGKRTLIGWAPVLTRCWRTSAEGSFRKGADVRLRRRRFGQDAHPPAVICLLRAARLNNAGRAWTPRAQAAAGRIPARFIAAKKVSQKAAQIRHARALLFGWRWNREIFAAVLIHLSPSSMSMTGYHLRSGICARNPGR
jgi:hypothetical protein